MIQMYCLSIIVNILAGLVFAIDYLSEKVPGAGVVKSIFEKKSLTFGLGIAAFVVGFLKLFAVYGGILILGDFFPAAIGMAIGAGLVFDNFKKDGEETSGFMAIIDSVILKNRSLFGIAGILIGILHFFFAGVIFL